MFGDGAPFPTTNSFDLGDTRPDESTHAIVARLPAGTSLMPGT
jgi:hypothetical protein